MTFEEDMKRLEDINMSLRNPQTSLEQAILLYEEGDRLRRNLEKMLGEISRRIDVVVSREPEPLATETLNTGSFR